MVGDLLVWLAVVGTAFIAWSLYVTAGSAENYEETERQDD